MTVIENSFDFSGIMDKRRAEYENAGKNKTFVQ